MKRIDILDQAYERRTPFAGHDVYPAFAAAYFDSLEAGNDTIDLWDALWDYDIEPILAECKRFGITEFTVSTGCDPVPRIADFVEHGCEIKGAVKVRAKYNDIWTHEKAVIPAILLRIGQAGGAEND